MTDEELTPEEMTKIMKEAGEKYRALREGIGKSQAELARMLGVSQNLISRRERGVTSIPGEAWASLYTLSMKAAEGRRILKEAGRDGALR